MINKIEFPLFKHCEFKRFSDCNWERGYIQINEDNSKLIVDLDRKPVLFIKVKGGWF